MWYEYLEKIYIEIPDIGPKAGEQRVWHIEKNGSRVSNIQALGLRSKSFEYVKEFNVSKF